MNDIEIDIYKMTSDWDKLFLLLWKNFLIQKRHKLQTVLEIGLPVIFASSLLILRSLLIPTYHDDVLKFEKFKCDSIVNLK